MGVLFEISIVCHVFVFVVLADGWGFSLFGGCSGLSAVFSRVRGSSGFSLLLAFLRFGRGGWGVGLLGGFLGFGVGRARFFSFFLLGVGWVRLARPAPAFLCGGWARVRAWFLTSLCFGGWGLGVFVCLVHSWDAVSGGGSGGPALFWGLGVPGFLFRVRGGFRSCSRRGFRVFLFPLGASFLWFGGCRVGLGLFFLRLFCSARVCFGFGCWFCLESLILAQDERWRRA